MSRPPGRSPGAGAGPGQGSGGGGVGFGAGAPPSGVAPGGSTVVGRSGPLAVPIETDPGPLVPAPPRRGGRRRHRRRRSRGERAVRGAVVLVAVVLLLAGSVYGYLWFRLGQIKSEKCSACAAAVGGAPYNVLVVGSDSRAGDTGQAAKSFGSAAEVGGQRSDTIKILHIDPAAGTARLLSIPRDTYVALSGMPSGTGLATDNKINTAFNSGPNPLIQTIENTFGIPINHFVIMDFDGVIDLVNSVGGIRLDFPYPARDNDDGNNNSGLNITHAGCQTLNGNMALALSRSRYYEYEVSPGDWRYDGTGDLGRIQRQDTIIEAVIDRAKSSYNPLTVNAFLGSIVHDITKDDQMSTSMILSLAQRYHAFSGSALTTYTLPTAGAYSSEAGDIEVVQQPAAEQVITQFLGTAPERSTTPPLDAYGSPVTVPPTTAPTTPPSSSGRAPATTTTTAPGTGPFNPTTC
ncbi:MAG TPA: LCP family protein [Acidimicrobiales bacterium]|nr:LCP family protein [Acidimicrobiales bacterium]